MAETLLDFMAESAKTTSVDALCRLFEHYVGTLGVEAIGYQILPSPFEASDADNQFEYNTFPDLMKDAYLGERLYEHDPVTSRASMALHPQFWFEVEQTTPSTRFSQRIFSLLREAGFVDGLTTPIFGPAGLAAYVACGRFSAPFNLSSMDCRCLQLACNELYAHTLKLEKRTAMTPPNLSEREIEVLHWLARGKSNAVIADILGVSPHTIDTVMRRAFAKLGASNRIAAVLKALRAGLITL